MDRFRGRFFAELAMPSTRQTSTGRTVLFRKYEIVRHYFCQFFLSYSILGTNDKPYSNFFTSSLFKFTNFERFIRVPTVLWLSWCPSHLSLNDCTSVQALPLLFPSPSVSNPPLSQTSYMSNNPFPFPISPFLVAPLIINLWYLNYNTGKITFCCPSTLPSNLCNCCLIQEIGSLLRPADSLVSYVSGFSLGLKNHVYGKST